MHVRADKNVQCVQWSIRNLNKDACYDYQSKCDKLQHLIQCLYLPEIYPVQKICLCRFIWPNDYSLGYDGHKCPVFNKERMCSAVHYVHIRISNGREKTWLTHSAFTQKSNLFWCPGTSIAPWNTLGDSRQNAWGKAGTLVGLDLPHSFPKIGKWVFQQMQRNCDRSTQTITKEN